MNCREFEEIADSYLSGELLVETNHEVLHHLENCSDCRVDLAERRELRERLQGAVRNSAPVDQAWAARVRAEIRSQADSRQPRALVPTLGLASVLILVLLGFAVYLFPVYFGPSNSARADLEEQLRQNGLMAALHDALGNHKHCGVKFGELPAKEIVDDPEYEILKAEFSRGLEFIEKHVCFFKGRKYTHTVLRTGGKLISILKTDSDSQSDPNQIVSVPLENVQIAEFESGHTSVFVISDVSESENLQVARVIANQQAA